MPANVFDLAIALVQAAPEVVPQILDKLGNRITPEQKQTLLTMQKSGRYSPRNLNISSGQWRVPPSQQFEQDLMKTIRHVPHREMNDIVYSVARERHRQVKEHFLFLRLFLIICLLTLVAGVILFFIFLLLEAHLLPSGVSRESSAASFSGHTRKAINGSIRSSRISPNSGVYNEH